MSVFGIAYQPNASTGKQAILRWMEALMSAPEGSSLEVGLTWTVERKWLVYQRIGDQFLMMSSEEARKIGRIYDKMRVDARWRDAGDGMMDTLGALKELAREAWQKNQAGEIPPEGFEAMPAEGSA